MDTKQPRISAWRLQNQDSDSNKNIHTITRKPWCDFVVYTYFMNHEDIHIQRIFFDPAFWEALKRKLLDFYLYAMVSELLTGRVKRGIPMYPNIFSYK